MFNPSQLANWATTFAVKQNKATSPSTAETPPFAERSRGRRGGAGGEKSEHRSIFSQYSFLKLIWQLSFPSIQFG